MTDEEEAKYEEQQKKKSNPAWWEGRVESIATEFEKLATSESLLLGHWKILTGSDEKTDSRYEHLEEGIFPRECDEYFLSLLTAEERGWIALSTQRDPLRFPCTPQRLLAFVDADPMGGFDVPDAFRSEVERLTEAVDQLAEKQPAETVAPTSLGATVIRNKLRLNTIDVPIDKAIAEAGCLTTANVWLKLKEIALNSEAPFTGLVEHTALCYTNDNDEVAKLTKNALDKRLALRRKAIA